MTPAVVLGATVVLALVVAAAVLLVPAVVLALEVVAAVVAAEPPSPAVVVAAASSPGHQVPAHEVQRSLDASHHTLHDGQWSVKHPGMCVRVRWGAHVVVVV